MFAASDAARTLECGARLCDKRPAKKRIIKTLNVKISQLNWTSAPPGYVLLQTLLITDCFIRDMFCLFISDADVGNVLSASVVPHLHPRRQQQTPPELPVQILEALTRDFV